MNKDTLNQERNYMKEFEEANPSSVRDCDIFFARYLLNNEIKRGTQVYDACLAFTAIRSAQMRIN